MMSFNGQAYISYSDLSFRTLDLKAEYGLIDLTPEGIDEFRKFLQDP